MCCCSPAVADCITAAQRLAVEQNLNNFASASGFSAAQSALPQQYRFQPVAGTLWQDRYVLNFFDVDPTTGIRDWDCSQFTYNGHAATDIMIRNFAEQDAGVPVFAALDGIVADMHDGENDRNTVLAGQPANYVILFHGGTHYTWYWHLRKGSIAVAVGQPVAAGTQIAQIGSSGHSEAPHVHFESRFDGYAYETYSGPCHPGPRHWVNQTAIPRHMWISEFGMHNSNNIPPSAFYPHSPPRTGTFVVTGGPQSMGAWYLIHNEPSGSIWRARYLRPDGSLFYDSGTRSLNNPFNRAIGRWFSFPLAPDVSGTWTLELSVNGQVLASAPFLVLSPGSSATNRPPNPPVTAVFEPGAPNVEETTFCRLSVPLPADADYDLVSFKFEWFINGSPFRTVTNAAYADAIPRGTAHSGDNVVCVVTPYDGQVLGRPVRIAANEAVPPALEIKAAEGNRVVLSWPTSVVAYALQAAGQLSATANWASVSKPAMQAGRRMYVTNDVPAGRKGEFYRLKSP